MGLFTKPQRIEVLLLLHHASILFGEPRISQERFDEAVKKINEVLLFVESLSEQTEDITDLLEMDKQLDDIIKLLEV